MNQLSGKCFLLLDAALHEKGEAGSEKEAAERTFRCLMG